MPQISNDHKLLPSSADREKVLELVDLHYKDCNIEQVTMGSMMANNKVCYTEKNINNKVTTVYTVYTRFLSQFGAKLRDLAGNRWWSEKILTIQ